MTRRITRRDFLNGVAIAASTPLMGALQPSPPYPPALTGLRGAHEGSWEAAHGLVEGRSWGDVAQAGETYDLIVVGGGISGLAAAYFYRQQVGPEASILVLDNHDDFGGHAKRNELGGAGRPLIGYGGSQSIDTPSGFSDVSRGLLDELGIELSRFETAFDRDLYASLGLGRGTFFDEETFGRDALVVRGDRSWEAFAAQTPLSPKARADLVRLHEDARDYFPDLSPDEKKRRLQSMSYRDFLSQRVGVDAQVLAYLQTRTNGQFGIGIDGVSALIAWRLNFPGLGHLGLERGPVGRMGQVKQSSHRDPYIFHFPDGNASIPRLLVRALVPGVASGRTMDDVVTDTFDYRRLDAPASMVRIRLESTVVRVRARSRGEGVDVTYVKNDQASSVRGRNVVLACWNSIIPFLCPELPERQKKALAYAVKVPLNYTNVRVRDWRAFHKLGVSSISCPGSFWSGVSLDFPVSMKGYDHPRSPGEPILLHLSRASTSPGLPPAEQFRTGRYELLSTSFEDFEREIRTQLARILGPGGFDPATDIEAITVNRWPHGYAYEYAYMGEPDWREEDKPCVVGRQRFGRVAIANSDAGGEAYVDSAIDQAHRAVQELIETAD